MPNTNANIRVYDAEREAGLSGLIQANTSLSYVTRLEDPKISQNAIRTKTHIKANDGGVDQFDLYYINTILVSTVWNKNDDVFAPAPVWEARNTPIHKQFNLEHDQSRIIGHMTTARAVNEKYELIPDDTAIANLPAKFHLLTGAVIYRALSDEKAQAEIDQIIKEIESGEWYVSMECLFSGFNYEVLDQDGKSKTIARSDESAFLTKHLRAYGGSGVYEGYKIGRALSSIVFSGKGLVRQPANPDSIIFNGESFASFCNSGYSNASDVFEHVNTGKQLIFSTRVNMPNENVSQPDPKLVEAEARIKELESTIKSHEASATTAKITSLTEELNAKAAKLETLEKEFKSTSEASKKLVEDTSAKLTEAETKLAQANTELALMKSEKVVASRIASLLERHAPKEDAENVVALFKDKDDAEFEKFVAILAKNWKPPVVAETAKPAPVVSAKPLESLEVPATPSLSVAHDEDNESLRKSMEVAFSTLFDSEKV